MKAVRPLPMRAAAMCAWFLGFGFGLPCAYGMWHLGRYGHTAIFLGFPTYGGGPLEAAGVGTTIPLLAGFLAVCATEVATGGLLWNGRRAGIVMAVAMLPFETFYWVGFDLPFGPPVGVARTVAMLAAVPLRRAAGARSTVG